jgi:1,4-dihydroxy-2-naphthoyl-CoA hydrolase
MNRSSEEDRGAAPAANGSTTFDQFVGMRFDDYESGMPRTGHLIIEAHHCNPTGAINGGVILSLADNLATGAAGEAYFEKTGERAFMVGVDLHASMLSNQQGGRIDAEAHVIRVGRRVTVIRTSVTGNDGKLLAEVTTTHLPARVESPS